MGIIDAFSAEMRIEVKFSDFYNLVKGCTERDLLVNAVKAGVPHRYIRETLSGKSEKKSTVPTEKEDSK